MPDQDQEHVDDSSQPIVQTLPPAPPAPAVEVLEPAGWQRLLPPGILDRYEVKNYRRAADVNLPDSHGIQVLKSIRDAMGRIPVVLTSAAFVDEIHRTIGLDAGADAYLITPLDPGELTFTLDGLLGR